MPSSNIQAIIFNGPPGSGKDHGAEHLSRAYNLPTLEMKERLIEIVCSIYGLTRKQWDEMYTRAEKERPQALLDGRSPRGALSYTAEEVIKPSYGKGLFGRATANMLVPGVNIISDGGFIEEIVEFEKRIGASNILVVRVQVEEPDWRDDPRRYLTEDMLETMSIPSVDVFNDHTSRFLVELEDAFEASSLWTARTIAAPAITSSLLTSREG